MSTNNSPKQSNNTRLALLAGILAIGLVAASIVGGQALSASAQQNPEEPMPVDLGCETGAEFCEDEIPPIVSTSGTSSVNVRPDKFSVTVGVETSGSTAQEAASSNAELVAQVIAALKALGIAESQLSTSQYSVHPVYSQAEPVNACRVMEGFPIPPECYVSGEVVSYKASSSVTVVLDVAGDIDAGKVIDGAVEAGANNVSGVYFFVSAEKQEEIRDSLIGDAIANARHRAQVAAEAVGMTVSGIQSISLDDVHFLVFSTGLDGATSVLPGEQQVSMTVRLTCYMVEEPVDGSGSFDVTEPARAFLQSRLAELGIQVENELDIHMDMVAHISENEYHVEFGVQDVNGQVHEGHIEVVDGEVVVAIMDGQSIL